MNRAIRFALPLLALTAACAPPAEEPPQLAAAAAVRVTAVRRGAIEATLLVGGETDALRSLRLASPVAGRITELTARVGDHIDAGAVAARLVPTENEAALHGLSVLDQTGSLDAGERSTAERLRRELARQAVAVRAPFSSTVAARLHNPDEQVPAGEALLELFDPASLVVMAQVPIDASSRVRPGMAVEIRMGTAVAPGVISALTGTVTPQVLTVPVRIALTSPLVPPLLHAAVECRIVTARHDDALLIPTAALLPAGGVGDAAVMVAVDGHAQRRTVALGLRDSEWVEVTSGLAADESVISEGAYGLPDGAAVAPLLAT